MSTIQIEVISVSVQTNPGKNGKTYQSLDVAYINRTFKNKVEGRKIMAFGATADTFKTLSNSTKGDVFDIDVVKNDNGFNDWVSAKKSSASGDASSQPSAPSGTGRPASGYASPSGRDFESKEERAKKQIYIVRQSSISSAIDLLSLGAKSPPKVDEIISVAKEFENYVFGDSTKAEVDKPEGFDDLEDVPL